MSGERIAILSDLPDKGGIPRLFVHLINAWADWGHQVDILCFRGTSVFYPDELPDSVRVFELPTRRKSTTLLALARYLYRERPKAIVSLTHPANLILAAARFLPGLKTRRVIGLQNNLYRGKDQRPGAKVRQVRRYYRFADTVLGASKGIEDRLRDLIGARGVPIRTIYNVGIGPDLGERMAEPPEHPWLRDKTEPVALAVGRLFEQKDYPMMLRAFAQVVKQRPCRLVVAGEGPDLDSLKGLAAELGIAERVSFAGFVYNPYALMAHADLFVLSSGWEGFGIVVAEALATGLPIVSTDCDHGPGEILQNGRFGRLVPVGDADAFAQAILATLDGDTPRFDRAEAIAPFQADVVARQYLDVFGISPSRRRSDYGGS